MNSFIIFFTMIVPSAYIDRNLAYLEYKTECSFIVTSGNRTHKHNMRVNGAPRSYHLTPNAAYDLVKGEGCILSYKELEIESRDIFDWARAYKTHFHVDLRKSLELL